MFSLDSGSVLRTVLNDEKEKLLGRDD